MGGKGKSCSLLREAHKGRCWLPFAALCTQLVIFPDTHCNTQCSILHTTQNILGLGETGLLFPVQLEMTGYQIAHKWSCYWFVELQRRWRSRKSSIPHGPWVTTAVWLELSEACRNLISKSKPLGSLSPSPLQSMNCSKIAHHIQNCTVLHCNCFSLRVISIMKPASLRVLCCYGFASLQ